MFKKRLVSVAMAALAVCAFAALSVGQASGATMEKVVGETKTPFLAIYGYPGASTKKPAVEEAIGGGLGRNFGAGENMVFQAGNGIGTALAIELENPATKELLAKSEAKESLIGGTLMSNKTGANNPLSFTIDLVDFQDNFLTVGKEAATKVPAYADTSDREWISEICSPTSATCKADAQFTCPSAGAGWVQINDVTFNIGPGTVVQGSLCAKWENGEKATKKPPCITLETPAAGNPTLVETQGAAVGAKAKAVTGKACLISANNDWYKVGTELEEPEITIANT
jgi:hypothetical protein